MPSVSMHRVINKGYGNVRYRERVMENTTVSERPIFTCIITDRLRYYGQFCWVWKEINTCHFSKTVAMAIVLQYKRLENQNVLETVVGTIYSLKS